MSSKSKSKRKAEEETEAAKKTEKKAVDESNGKDVETPPLDEERSGKKQKQEAGQDAATAPVVNPVNQKWIDTYVKSFPEAWTNAIKANAFEWRCIVQTLGTNKGKKKLVLFDKRDPNPFDGGSTWTLPPTKVMGKWTGHWGDWQDEKKLEKGYRQKDVPLKAKRRIWLVARDPYIREFIDSIKSLQRKAIRLALKTKDIEFINGVAAGHRGVYKQLKEAGAVKDKSEDEFVLEQILKNNCHEPTFIPIEYPPEEKSKPPKERKNGKQNPADEMICIKSDVVRPKYEDSKGKPKASEIPLAADKTLVLIKKYNEAQVDPTKRIEVIPHTVVAANTLKQLPFEKAYIGSGDVIAPSIRCDMAVWKDEFDQQKIGIRVVYLSKCLMFARGKTNDFADSLRAKLDDAEAFADAEDLSGDSTPAAKSNGSSSSSSAAAYASEFGGDDSSEAPMSVDEA